MTHAQIEIALRAAILSLNAANDAATYADSALRKAKEAQKTAAEAVAALEKLSGEAWQAEHGKK